MALKKGQMRGISAGDSVSKGRHWESVERAHLWVGSKEGEQECREPKEENFIL